MDKKVVIALIGLSGGALAVYGLLKMIKSKDENQYKSGAFKLIGGSALVLLSDMIVR